MSVEIPGQNNLDQETAQRKIQDSELPAFADYLGNSEEAQTLKAPASDTVRELAQSFSPSQPKVASIADQKQMKFAEALAWLLDRSKVATRPSWLGSEDDYAYISDDGFLMIHRATGEHTFAVHETDIRGVDWVVMSKPQVAPREVIEV